MKNLYSAGTDTSTVDNLVSGTLVPCKMISAPLAAGTGVLPRGTLLTAGEDGTYSAAKEEAVVIDGILWLDKDISDPDEIVAVPIAASGEFNQNKIEEATGFNLTVAQIQNARGKQIYIAPMNPESETF